MSQELQTIESGRIVRTLNTNLLVLIRIPVPVGSPAEQGWLANRPVFKGSGCGVEETDSKAGSSTGETFKRINTR